MTGTSSFQQTSIPTKTAPPNSTSSSTSFHNRQKLITNQPNRQQQYFRSFQAHVIKPLRSNQSLILPGMGIIGRSIKFEVNNLISIKL